MVGLLVQYVDDMGDNQTALFQGTQEKAQENIDRFFTSEYKGEMLSSVEATDESVYDHTIMDSWTTPYYGSDMSGQTAAVVLK